MLRGPAGEGDGLVPHSQNGGIHSPALAETHFAFGGRCNIAGKWPNVTGDRVSTSGDPSSEFGWDAPCEILLSLRQISFHG